MQRFTAMDLQRNVGPVQEAALREPVADPELAALDHLMDD